jgi:WD40 repeat protein
MAANPEKLKLVKDVSFKAIAFGIARVPKSTRFYVGASDFKVYEIDLVAAKPEPKELYAHGSYVTGVAVSGKTLVSGSYDGKLVWWDTEKNKEIRGIESAHSKWIRRVRVSPNGKLLASVADDMVCRIWEAETGKKVHELRGHQEMTPNNFTSMLYAVAFSPDGKYLATGDKVGHVVVWDVTKGSQIATMEAPIMYTWDPVQRLHSIGGIRSLAFSPDSKLLAVGGTGKIGNIDHLEAKARVEIFEWQNQKKYAEFADTKFQGLSNYLVFSQNSEWLMSAGGAGEGFLMSFDVKGKKAAKGEKVGMHVHDVAINEEMDTFYCAGHNKIAIWEMKG